MGDGEKRETVLARVKEELRRIGDPKGEPHTKACCALVARPTPGRYVKTDKKGQPMLEPAKVSPSATNSFTRWRTPSRTLKTTLPAPRTRSLASSYPACEGAGALRWRRVLRGHRVTTGGRCDHERKSVWKESPRQEVAGPYQRRTAQGSE